MTPRRLRRRASVLMGADWQPQAANLHPLLFSFTAFSLPRTSDVKTPIAAIDAHTIKAAWKPEVNACCRELISAGDKAGFETSSRPAAAPPREAKMAPASATLKL